MPRPAAGPPMVHRKNVLGYRVACVETWGQGTFEQVIRQLPPHVREATAGLLPMDEWVPEDFVVAWAETVWAGPAERQDETMRRYVAATINHGFGRVRQMLLQLATPDTLASRAGRLWREEHTTGELVAEVLRPGQMRLVLRDHPYVENPVARFSVAESFRAIVALTRVPAVTESHSVRGDALVVNIRWSTDR